MTQKEAIKELHDRVRQCFTRHRFVTFGDALEWWHDADHEEQKLEAAEQGMSKFSTDFLWLISIFGPKTKVDYTIMATRKVPKLVPVKVDEQDDPLDFVPEPKRVSAKRRRKRRF